MKDELATAESFGAAAVVASRQASVEARASMISVHSMMGPRGGLELLMVRPLRPDLCYAINIDGIPLGGIH